jgi:hypothetical protein
LGQRCWQESANEPVFSRAIFDLIDPNSREGSSPAFVCRDGNYLSARWPGDVFTFGQMFATMLNE